MRVRRSLLTDTVTVETYSGQGARGPVYEAPATVKVQLVPKRHLVRSADGTEMVSEFNLVAHPDDEARFTPESKVTSANRTSRALTVSAEGVRGYTTLVRVYCS